MSQKTLIGIVVITVVVIAGAFLMTGSPETSMPQPPAPSGSKSPPPPAAVKPTPQIPARTISVAEVKQLIASNPWPDTSPEKTKAFSDRVAAAAVDSPALDLAKCEPNPGVLRVKLGSSITLVSSDKAQHEIVVNVSGKQNKYTTVSGGTTEVRFDFASAGIYAYGCDASLSAGVLLVVTE